MLVPLRTDADLELLRAHRDRHDISRAALAASSDAAPTDTSTNPPPDRYPTAALRTPHTQHPQSQKIAASRHSPFIDPGYTRPDV